MKRVQVNNKIVEVYNFSEKVEREKREILYKIFPDLDKNFGGMQTPLLILKQKNKYVIKLPMGVKISDNHYIYNVINAPMELKIQSKVRDWKELKITESDIKDIFNIIEKVTKSILVFNEKIGNRKRRVYYKNSIKKLF